MSLHCPTLIIEFSYWHIITLVPQLEMLLNRGCDVTLVLVQNHPDTETIDAYRNCITIIELPKKYPTNADMFRLWQLVTFTNWQRIVIASEMYDSGRYLAALLLSGKRFVHMLHRTHYLPPHNDKPFFKRLMLRRLFARVTKHLVLSPTLVPTIETQHAPRLKDQLALWYPIYPRLLQQMTQHDRITFIIPGPINTDVRNYESLADALVKLATSPLKHRIHFNLLGWANVDMGHQLRNLIAELDVPETLITMLPAHISDYMDYMTFTNIIATAHFIVPLIDQTIQNEMRYNAEVSPSAVMHSRNLAVPLLVSDTLGLDDDLQQFAVTYEGTDLYRGVVDAVQWVGAGLYDEKRIAYQQYKEGMLQEAEEAYFRI